jgi:hypothetical protein
VTSDWFSGKELLKFLALIAAVRGIVMPLSGMGDILHASAYVMIGCAALAGVTLLLANKCNH